MGYTIKEFIIELDKRGLKMKEATLRDYDKRKLLIVEKNSENNYRNYSDDNVTDVFKIVVLQKYLRINKEDFRKIVSCPNHLMHLLDHSEKRDSPRNITNLNIAGLIYQMLKDDFRERIAQDPTNWYAKTDWIDLYKRCINFDPVPVDKLVGEIMNRMDHVIGKLLKEAEGQLTLEYYRKVKDRSEINLRGHIKQYFDSYSTPFQELKRHLRIKD
jgi:DNA-binding transcriptional MerR regulator